VSSPPDHPPSEPRSSIRTDARLDPTTRQKVDELAARFHQPRVAVLCHIMRWGLSRGQADALDHSYEGPVRHLYLYVEVELHEHVQKAAAAMGVKIAPWLRQMVCEVTLTDFPASWQDHPFEERSHDSPVYRERFMLRLDKASRTRLQALVERFDISRAEIIRQLIFQANAEAFPKRWHMRAAERRAQQARRDDTDRTQELRP
jgi:predicted transcriptional regulator